MWNDSAVSYTQPYTSNNEQCSKQNGIITRVTINVNVWSGQGILPETTTIQGGKLTDNTKNEKNQ